MKELASRLSELASLVERPGTEDRFASEYERLLGELSAAMRLMKELASLQVRWLRGQANECGRMNRRGVGGVNLYKFCPRNRMGSPLHQATFPMESGA